MSIPVRPISRVLSLVGHALIGTSEGLRAMAPRRGWLIAGAIVGAAAAGAALTWLAMAPKEAMAAPPREAARAGAAPRVATEGTDGAAAVPAPEPFE